LTVNGVATFSAAVHMKSTLSISGAVALGTTLGVTGQSSLAGLTVAGTSTLSGTVILSNGQLQFPATQNASSNANTLDDYEEGTFTPSLTFATPGNLTVVYSTRVGRYTKIGETVTVNFRMVTTTWTHTTASGASLVTGLPFSTPASPSDISYVLSTGVTTGPQPGTNWSLPGLVIGASASTASLFLSNLASGSSIAMTPPNMPSGTQMEVSAGGTYQV
jgi:hypothetical protein